jgi:hypothetical protein
MSCVSRCYRPSNVDSTGPRRTVSERCQWLATSWPECQSLPVAVTLHRHPTATGSSIVTPAGLSLPVPVPAARHLQSPASLPLAVAVRVPAVRHSPHVDTLVVVAQIIVLDVNFKLFYLYCSTQLCTCQCTRYGAGGPGSCHSRTESAEAGSSKKPRPASCQ